MPNAASIDPSPIKLLGSYCNYASDKSSEILVNQPFIEPTEHNNKTLTIHIEH